MPSVYPTQSKPESMIEFIFWTGDGGDILTDASIKAIKDYEDKYAVFHPQQSLHPWPMATCLCQWRACAYVYVRACANGYVPVPVCP